MKEAEDDAPRLAFGLARSELSQHGEVALGVRSLRLRAFEVGRIDDHVGARQLAHLLQLGRGERGLSRPTATQDDDLADRRARDGGDRGVGRVRRRELFVGQREHPRHVERHVPVPDHDHPLDRKVELELLVVGMAVVPGDELGGRPRTRQVLARNPQPAVGLGADGVDDGVVETHEVGVVKVAADLDVAEEPEPRPLGDPLEGTRHRLQLRVVGSDAEPDETPRRRQALDQIHLDRRVRRQQGAGGVEACRAGADYRDAHGGDARGSA